MIQTRHHNSTPECIDEFSPAPSPTIIIARIPGIYRLFNTLTEKSYKVKTPWTLSSEYPDPKELREVIWIGSQVSGPCLKEVVRDAFSYMPHLKYVCLTSDISRLHRYGLIHPQTASHHRIAIGGLTSTARKLGLQAWKKADFDRMMTFTDTAALHSFIRKISIPAIVMDAFNNAAIQATN